jgi:hypothetical protein
MSHSQKCHGSGKLANSQYNVLLLSRLLGGFLCPQDFPFVLIIRGALQNLREKNK